MVYVVLDLEWNQAMSKQSHPFIEIGDKLPFEIFQIGAVKLDENGKTVDGFKATIRLKYYRRLHFMVKKLTGIDADQISSGEPFREAIARFREWCGNEVSFVTWGYDDIPILKQNLEFYGLPTDWCETWYNLQVIFNRQRGEGKDQRSLEYAMEQFGIEADHQLHDAMVDASYTAQIAQHLDFLEGIRSYEESVWSIHPKKIVEKEKARAYPTRKAALEDLEISRIGCPVCGKILSNRIRWKKTPDGGYSAQIACETHGPFICRLRFRRRNDGWVVTKLVRNTKPRKRRKRRAAERPAQQPEQKTRS